MSPAALEILDLLQNDIVSYDWVCQCIRTCEPTVSEQSMDDRVSSILDELLSSKMVAIGETARKTSPECVEFIIAWRGSVDARVLRALAAVESYTGLDRNYAFWLCLTENVDRYEDPKS